ncbi:MAG: hypothetical protein KA146_00460 [Leptospiraceae bacterium]|nr:hypothetical protein [Leptospiraceae bacterium]
MNIQERMKHLEERQHILEHIIRVIFSLFKSKIEKSVRTQIDNALLTITELKKSAPTELQNDIN